MNGDQMDQEATSLAVHALWLQYKGLTVESGSARYRVENAAWRSPPPSESDDLPGIAGLRIAT
jgi:hypothetical protein